MADTTEAVLAELEEAVKDKFWGEITVVYRGGIPTLVRKNQTIQLDGRTDNAKREFPG